MKRVLLMALTFCSYAMVVAQLHDAQWVLNFRTSVLDFRNPDTIGNYTIEDSMFSSLTNANICDENGNLLYYTNGIYIAGSDGNALLNGKGLSPCPYTDVYSMAGLNIQQAALFIPKPGDLRYYYLFHFSNDTLHDSRPGTLYYSLIDKSGNFGLGEVVQKNIPILKNVVLRDGGMTACKHANGRDYWLIKAASILNRFYKYLITPDSIIGPYIQDIGSFFPLPFDNSYSKFSQDGSKYITGTFKSLVLVMDFDRCSGEFSNPVNIYNETSTDPVHHPTSGCASVEFSPNNRFAYVANRINLNQYDLWAENIQDSVELYRADSADFAQMDMLQIAPNGKLYASCWNGGVYFMHVINRPNEKGDSCGFIYGSLTTLTPNTNNVPNLINYKLGPLAGSGCDTISTSVFNPGLEELMQVQPNPADKYLYVEVFKQGDYELLLFNAIGQLIDKKQTRQVDIFDTESLSEGVYFIKTIDLKSRKEIATKKVAIMH